MKNVVCCCFLALIAILDLPAQTEEGKHYGEAEEYRRSSLCIILINHRGKQFADEIFEEFLNMTMPAKYNDHNIDLRVFTTTGDDATEKDVIRIMNEQQVAKDLVAQWFDRDETTGMMDMNLIHQRGGYNATYSDVQRVQSTERGVAALSEEGVDLIQNTFVLVCDMDYYDKSNTSIWFALALAGASGYLQADAQNQAKKGNYRKAQSSQQGAQSAMVLAGAVADIGGFSVKMRAHLLRLQWTTDMTQKMFGEYWIDEDTPIEERISRRMAFNNDSTSFQLEYIGMYKARSGKVAFKSMNDMHEVIRNVCQNTIDEGMAKLAKSYPVFRPKTTFYCDGGMIYAYIGRKEGVTAKSKYEVMQPVKKNGQLTYKKVEVVKPLRVWDNQQVDLSQLSDWSGITGTSFKRKKKKDICGKGYLLREKP